MVSGIKIDPSDKVTIRLRDCWVMTDGGKAIIDNVVGFDPCDDWAPYELPANISPSASPSAEDSPIAPQRAVNVIETDGESI